MKNYLKTFTLVLAAMVLAIAAPIAGSVIGLIAGPAAVLIIVYALVQAWNEEEDNDGKGNDSEGDRKGINEDAGSSNSEKV